MTLRAYFVRFVRSVSRQIVWAAFILGAAACVAEVIDDWRVLPLMAVAGVAAAVGRV